jgi:hypothetical protein
MQPDRLRGRHNLRICAAFAKADIRKRTNVNIYLKCLKCERQVTRSFDSGLKCARKCKPT